MRRSVSPSYVSKRSCASVTFPIDFDIFSPLTVTNPLCTQYLEKEARSSGFPCAQQLWAISFSWCGNFKSAPPP